MLKSFFIAVLLIIIFPPPLVAGDDDDTDDLFMYFNVSNIQPAVNDLFYVDIILEGDVNMIRGASIGIRINKNVLKFEYATAAPFTQYIWSSNNIFIIDTKREEGALIYLDIVELGASNFGKSPGRVIRLYFEVLNYGISSIDFEATYIDGESVLPRISIGTSSTNIQYIDKIDFQNTQIIVEGTDVSIEDDGSSPIAFKLYQNYPNPFNPSTNMIFDIREQGFYKLDIYNVQGQHIETLVKSDLSMGSHRVTFNSQGLSSGIYI